MAVITEKRASSEGWLRVSITPVRERGLERRRQRARVRVLGEQYDDDEGRERTGGEGGRAGGRGK